MAVLPPDPIFSLQNVHMGPVHCLCFHLTNDSELLLAGTQDGHVFTWDLKTNRALSKLAVGKTPLLSVHHSADSLFTQEKQGIIKIWKKAESDYVVQDIVSTEYCGFCRCHISETNNLLFQPQADSKINISNLDGTLIMTLIPEVDLKLGEIMCFKPLEVSNNQYLLAAYESGDLLLWDLKIKKVISKLKLRDCPMTLDYDLATNRGIYGNASENIQVFSMGRNDFNLTLKCEIILKNAGVNVLKIREDKKVFMSAGWDGRLRIYSWKSLRPLAVLTEHKAALQDVCHSVRPVSMWNSSIMAAGGLDCKITLWDIYN